MNFSIPTPKPTGRHPVADNPIRLLFGKGWSSPTDLRQSARTMALRASRESIRPDEPHDILCPRVRNREDYVNAEREVSAPTSFAKAIAFWPKERRGNGVDKALLGLLTAEGLEPTNPGRSKQIREAIQILDSDEGKAQIHSASEFVASEKMLGLRPVEDDVQKQFYRELSILAEKAVIEIRDLTDPVSVEQVELLDTLANCRRVDEVSALAVTSEKVVERLIDLSLRPFFVASDGFFKKTGHLVRSVLPKSELESLIEKGFEFKRALRLISTSQCLRAKLSENDRASCDSRRLHLAWAIGLAEGRWNAAARLSEGVDIEAAISPDDVDFEMATLLRLARKVIPLMELASATYYLGKSGDHESWLRLWFEVDPGRLRRMGLVGGADAKRLDFPLSSAAIVEFAASGEYGLDDLPRWAEDVGSQFSKLREGYPAYSVLINRLERGCSLLRNGKRATLDDCIEHERRGDAISVSRPINQTDKDVKVAAPRKSKYVGTSVAIAALLGVISLFVYGNQAKSPVRPNSYPPIVLPPVSSGPQAQPTGITTPTKSGQTESSKPNREFLTSNGRIYNVPESALPSLDAKSAVIDRMQAAFDARKKVTAEMRAGLDAMDARVSEMQADLRNEEVRLDRLSKTNVSAYNSRVPAYNAKLARQKVQVRETNAFVEKYNARLDEDKRLLNSLNRLVDEYNTELVRVGTPKR